LIISPVVLLLEGISRVQVLKFEIIFSFKVDSIKQIAGSVREGGMFFSFIPATSNILLNFAPI